MVRGPRWAGGLAALVVAAVAGPARAQPAQGDPPPVDPAATAAVTGLVEARGDGGADAVAPLFDRAVAYDVRDLGCDHLAGKGRATGSRRLQLARCLIGDDGWSGATVDVGRTRRGWTARIVAANRQLALELRTVKGAVRITSVKAKVTPTELGGAESGDSDDGIEGGVMGGVVGGVIGDTVTPPLPPPPPPPPPARVLTVAPVALSALRIAGTETPVADAATRAAVAAKGRTRVAAVVKVCVDTRGLPDLVQVLKASGFPGWDRAVNDTVQGWRFRPFMVNGNATPICSAFTFVYQSS